MSNISRNAPCPCGSGRKFKQCCIDKEIDWVIHEDGTVERSIELSPEVFEMLSRMREAHIAKHGTEPTGPIFADAPPLEHMEHFTIEAMKKAGVEPALIYAYEKTGGLMLNPDNIKKIPQSDVDEWEAAIDEYEAKTGLTASRRLLSVGDFQGILKNPPPGWR